MVQAKKKFRPQIKNIWGLAKSKELNLSDEELYSIIFRETGKESMRELTTKELNKVILALGKEKDRVTKREKRASKEQIWKIRELEKELNWEDNPKRLIAFIKKYYKVEKLEWLTSKDAWRLIESLKKMLEKS
jgi:hypothetical protein